MLAPFRYCESERQLHLAGWICFSKSKWSSLLPGAERRNVTSGFWFDVQVWPLNGNLLVVCGRFVVICSGMLVVCGRLLVVCGRLCSFVLVCARLCSFVVVVLFSNYESVSKYIFDDLFKQIFQVVKVLLTFKS